MIKQRFSRFRSYLGSEGLGPFLARALAGSAMVQFAGMAFAFLVGVQLARGLGASGFGYYGMAMAIITVATLPAAMGLPKLVMREVAAADARDDAPAVLGVLRWATRASWRMSLLVSLLVAGGAAVAFARGSTVLGFAVLAGIPMIPLLPLANIRAGALRALHRVVLSQLVMVLLRPMGLSILLFALLIANRPITAPGAVALTTLVAAAVLIAAQVMLKPRLPKAEPRLDEHRSWLSSTIPMALSDAVQSLQWQLATIALGLLATAAEVGILRVATSTAIVTGVPAIILASAVVPMFARLHAVGEHAQLQRLATLGARLQFTAVAMIVLPLMVGAEFLLSTLFGPTFAPAAPTLRILLIGQLITTAFGANGALLNMTGHERRVTRGVGIGLALNISLVLLLAGHWGSVGTAVAVVASQLCWNLLLWWDARRLLGIDTSIAGARVGHR
ncbi:MAG TPA: flippase [Sphingomicrobium sp.]|nr:flippase [Sphingomicrobium sp.]